MTFMTDFTDAYRLLAECEIPMTVEQLADELQWPVGKKTFMRAAAKSKKRPKGIVWPNGLVFKEKNGIMKFQVEIVE